MSVENEIDLSRTKVAVINAFGRSDSVCVSLAQNNFEVHHFDLSSKLGHWSLEDIRGPFGYLREEPIDPILIEQQHYSDQIHFLPKGFCFWGSKGPIETKSPIFLQMMQKFVDKNIITKEELRSDFKNLWPLLFLNTWNSISEWEWKSSQFSNDYKKWMFEFGFVHPTRQGDDRRLDWFKEKGVIDHRQFQILDFANTGKQITALELEGPERGLMYFDEIIWSLSLEQTQFSHPEIAERLFGPQKLHPDYSWVRYRFELVEKNELQYLPRHMVLIKDEYDQWTHENYLILQRTPMQGFWDIWCKIPTHQRFSQTYIENMKSRIEEHLKLKLPNIQSLSVILPPESQYSYQEIGPAPFGTFRQGLHLKNNWNNLHFQGPESRASFGINENQEKNKFLLDQLISRREEKLKKRKAHNS